MELPKAFLSVAIYLKIRVCVMLTFYLQANNTVTDEIVVFTGIGEVNLANEIDTWKGEE